VTTGTIVASHSAPGGAIGPGLQCRVVNAAGDRLGERQDYHGD
jgi:hypothetical protein